MRKSIDPGETADLWCVKVWQVANYKAMEDGCYAAMIMTQLAKRHIGKGPVR